MFTTNFAHTGKSSSFFEESDYEINSERDDFEVEEEEDFEIKGEDSAAEEFDENEEISYSSIPEETLDDAVLTLEDASFQPYKSSFAPTAKFLDFTFTLTSVATGFALGYATKKGWIPPVTQGGGTAEAAFGSLRSGVEVVVKMNMTLENLLLAQIAGNHKEQPQPQRIQPSAMNYTLITLASAAGVGFMEGAMNASLYGSIAYGAGMLAASIL